MFVESIELKNYRNINSAKIVLSPGVNIFFGDNAQGKTNLLESVYVSSVARSHRGSRDRELIRFGEEDAHIRLFFRKEPLSHRLDVHLRKNHSKGIAIDSIPVKRSADLMGVLPVVFFSPEDLSLIKNGPAGRRRFVDMEMSQLDRLYLKNLIAYNKILTERNNLLKQINVYPALIDTLDGWDHQLIESGLYLIRKRREFSLEINRIMKTIHSGISGGKEEILVEYDPNTTEMDFRENVRRNRNKDILSGSTSCGPHKDDLLFSINGIDIRRFGSQGQQRTAALSLKLSEIRLMEDRIGDKPVLLLDDVLSELDVHRQNQLLNHIRDVQTLVSCTGLDELVRNRADTDKIYRVRDGNFSEYKEDGTEE